MGVNKRTVTWTYYKANRHRRDGTPRAGDMPIEDGRDWRPVDSGLGWQVRIESPWWWEQTIREWLAGRPAARAEAWTRPHGPRGEFVTREAS
jgi:hypothetical protein